MKKVSQSAVQKHYLQSILPHPTYPTQKQILKTKQFYQPEQFVWNNPHRTSDQMYKFYHAYNEHYNKYKEPALRDQEEHDRQAAQMQRIHRLIAFRTKTRDQFAKKQRNRELLQSKVVNPQRSVWKSVKTDHVGVQPEYKHLTELKDDIFKKSATKEAQKSERVIRIENTYKQGLKNRDIKTQEINKLINSQHQNFHREIRSEFASRKNNNDSTNNRFYSKVKKTKLFEQQVISE